MTCRRASDVDLAAYLVESDAPEWAEFRSHFPDCADCSEQVAAWTRTEASLRASAEASAVKHTPADLLAQFERVPQSLPAGERRDVEAHLSACRPCADQVAALREFDFSFIEKTAPASPWAALKTAGGSVGRWLASVVPRRSPEGEGGWLGEGLFPSPEPAVAFQSREAAAADSTTGGVHAAGAPLPVAVLAAVAGEVAGEVYRVHPGENRVGRASECEVRIPSVSLGRVEVRITEQEGRFEITAAHEHRPVVVNGTSTQAGPLADGDLLEIAGLRFHFRTLESA